MSCSKKDKTDLDEDGDSEVESAYTCITTYTPITIYSSDIDAPGHQVPCTNDTPVSSPEDSETGAHYTPIDPPQDPGVTNTPFKQFAEQMHPPHDAVEVSERIPLCHFDVLNDPDKNCNQNNVYASIDDTALFTVSNGGVNPVVEPWYQNGQPPGNHGEPREPESLPDTDVQPPLAAEPARY